MDIGYQCKSCEFFGKTLTLMKRHLMTKKHSELSTDTKLENYKTIKYKCKLCHSVCCTKFNIKRHIEKCDRSEDKSDDKLIKIMVESISNIKDKKKMKEAIHLYIKREKKLITENKNREIELIKKNKNREFELATKINNIYENENNFHKSVVKSAGQMVNKTVNMMTYAAQNFKDTPKLEIMDSVTARKLLSFEGNVQVAEYIAKMSEAKILSKCLGNVLTTHYKKDITCQQSLWATDANRIKFIVRTSDGWIKDNNNELISRIMITPLLKEVSKIMDEYCMEQMKYIDDMTKLELDKYAEVSSQRISIKEKILNTKLCKSIIKFIAPYFLLRGRITEK